MKDVSGCCKSEAPIAASCTPLWVLLLAGRVGKHLNPHCNIFSLQVILHISIQIVLVWCIQG